MNTFVRECAAADIFGDRDAGDLFAEYAAECANPLLGATNPVSAMYEMLEGSGNAQCFAGYVGDPVGKMCGFAVVLTSSVPHYGRPFATVESLFVSRDGRRSSLGAELMHAAEAYAGNRGCSAIFYTAPVNSRLAKLLFFKAEYCNTNLIFTKRLA